jgi:hypothetical protein
MSEAGRPQAYAGRATASARVFPLPDPQMYTKVGEGDLLWLAHASDGRRRPDARGRVARLLRSHRLALTAEVAGRWRRGDFYWLEFANHLRALDRDGRAWKDVASRFPNASDSSQPTDAAELRRALIDEVGIDTHCALHNAYSRAVVDRPNLAERMRFHLDRLVELAEARGPMDEDARALIGPALESRMANYRAMRAWRAALEDGERLVRHFPEIERYHLLLANLVVEETVARLKTSTTSASHGANAACLKMGISRIDGLRARYPDHIELFDILAMLHHRRAIELMSAQQLAQALVANQAAMLFHPGEEQYELMQRSLIDAMRALRSRMQELVAQLRGRRRQLSAEGQQLQREATLGFGPLESYLSSKAAAQIPAARKTAEAHRAEHPVEGAASRQVDYLNFPIGDVARRRSWEPLGDWVFSRQDRRAKVQSAVAVLLLLGISHVTVDGVQRAQTRNAAYAQVMDGAIQHADRTVLDGAETFLANQPLLFEDSRAAAVKDVYAQSLVRWFMTSNGQPADEATDRVAKYRSLALDRGPAGGQP